uniref:Uncharacterized protein n=1 Tax=Rhizophora mucronata TaxID=61149 RepID=A0A2P2JGL1_RHIMU
MTYIRHLGHPTSAMDAASGLFECGRLSSWLTSDDRQELGGEVGDTVADRVGVSTLGLALGGDRFSFRSSLGVLPFLRLIFCVLCAVYLTSLKVKELLPARGERAGLLQFNIAGG